MYVRKKSRLIAAWRLGDGTAKEREMIAQGKIVKRADGTYEIASRESVGGVGQIASKGDYFKVDLGGYPYPNAKQTFEATHTHDHGDWYVQQTPLLPAWVYGQPMTDEVKYLLDGNIVKIDESDPARFYTARLWGTQEYASKDAVIVFYRVDRDGDGRITDAEFNFVERSEFEKTYRVEG